MTTLDQLIKICSLEEAEAYHTYLNNKHKGGRNNSKGNSFENYFAVYQIAKTFNENAATKSVLFSAQTFSFVDDLVIAFPNDNTFHYFQLKDTEQLSWYTGNHPLVKDFTIQYQLSIANAQNVLLTLAVTSKQLHDSMQKSVPETIKMFTTVSHFRTATSINSLIRNNAEFKNELVKMCALSNPGADKLDALGTILLGAWDATDKTNISLQVLLDRCYNQNPNYIKGFEGRVSVALNNTLNTIPGFTFTVEHGYLVWNYYATDNGILQYPLGTSNFAQWENDIINLGQNISFEILEPFLS